MCGRFTLSLPAAEIAEAFDLEDVPEAPPRYNIAPSQPVATIIETAEKPERQIQLMRWGLIPSWAKDPAIGNKLINARAETVSEKPSFRAAFKRRRCLIPADGFYEWQKLDRGKQPYFFHLNNHKLFAFAGLWESWNDIETVTIVTTEANELLKPVHDRMPVILHPDDYERWLDPQNQNAAELQALLKPFPSERMNAYPVSNKVNRPINDSSELIDPAISE
jgi:putative SOS response-associated peptidase YedK